MQRIRRELKVELNIVRGAVVQVNKGPPGLEQPLEEVVTWPKGEDRVQRGDIAAAGGVVEEVAIAILDEAALGLRAGELLLVEREVRGEPGTREQVKRARDALGRTRSWPFGCSRRSPSTRMRRTRAREG